MGGRGWYLWSRVSFNQTLQHQGVPLPDGVNPLADVVLLHHAGLPRVHNLSIRWSCRDTERQRRHQGHPKTPAYHPKISAHHPKSPANHPHNTSPSPPKHQPITPKHQPIPETDAIRVTPKSPSHYLKSPVHHPHNTSPSPQITSP